MRRCSSCLYDETVPDITFDTEGRCNYCELHTRMCQEYPSGQEGKEALRALAEVIRSDGKGRQFDCIVGVSGGCDSSFLLCLAKRELGLRPLAVHFDNSWDSTLARSNMEKVTKGLDVPFEVLGYTDEQLDEYNSIYSAFLSSGTRDIDSPTDVGLATVLYRAAVHHGVRHILEGNCFRTEGVQPLGWTYMDGRYLADVLWRHRRARVRAFPNLWLTHFAYWACIRGLRRHRPLYYYDYNKSAAMAQLSDGFGWEWYGGHHLENHFTTFTYAHYLFRRFGIDGRLNGHSALVRSGQVARDSALQELSMPPSCPDQVLQSVRERFALTEPDLEALVTGGEHRSYRDYRTYKPLFERTRPLWEAMGRRDRVPMSFVLKYCSPDRSTYRPG